MEWAERPAARNGIFRRPGRLNCLFGVTRNIGIDGLPIRGDAFQHRLYKLNG